MKRILGFIVLYLLISNTVSGQTARPTIRTSWFETVQWILTGQETLSYKTFAAPIITGNMTFINTDTVTLTLDDGFAFSDPVVAPTINALIDTSTANDTYGGIMAPTPPAYTTGTLVIFVPAVNNIGACTLAYNGQTVKNIKTASGADPANSDLVTTSVSILIYDGTNWILTNPATSTD